MSPLILPSAVEAIGDTPLVDCARLARYLDGRILAKLENLNPGYSKKDRVARQIIADAEAAGSLRPGQTVIELTSGHTGPGLAIVCGVKGYPFVAVMSRGNSVERARMMRALGAEVVLVDQADGSVPGQVSGADIEKVERETEQLVDERGAFRADQFRLCASSRAHYLHTGPEILRQSEGQIDAFVDFVGSGGSFAGCSTAFKEHDAGIRCFIAEPEQAAVLSGTEPIAPNHRIQGGGYSRPALPLLDSVAVDGYVKITDAEAITAARRLAAEEGVFGGFSAGARVESCFRMCSARRPPPALTTCSFPLSVSIRGRLGGCFRSAIMMSPSGLPLAGSSISSRCNVSIVVNR